MIETRVPGPIQFLLEFRCVTPHALTTRRIAGLRHLVGYCRLSRLQFPADDDLR